MDDAFSHHSPLPTLLTAAINSDCATPEPVRLFGVESSLKQSQQMRGMIGTVLLKIRSPRGAI